MHTIDLMEFSGKIIRSPFKAKNIPVIVLGLIGVLLFFSLVSVTRQAFAVSSTESSLCFTHIKKFDSNGKYVSGWGPSGSLNGQFLHIHGIATDRLGNIYAVDEQKQDIQKFDNKGKFLISWGATGSGPGQFSNKLEDINVDSNGDVYVVDYGNNRISKFSSSGKFINSWGSKGEADGQFNRPWGVAFDSHGNVFVTDQRNNRIQKFDNTGKFINSIKPASGGMGALFIYMQ